MENDTQVETEVTTETTNEIVEDTAVKESADQQDTTHENMATDQVVIKTEPGSPIAPTKKLEGVELLQNKMSTPFILVFLFVVFFVLKSFIYTKDDKRHGK